MRLWHMRLWHKLALAAGLIWLGLLPSTAQAPAAPGTDVMRGCKTLAACLRILDRYEKSDAGIGPVDEGITAYMRRFGVPAKEAMLVKANGHDEGWKNLAGYFLSEWPAFEAKDVPQLVSALEKDPGGWVARSLAKIPTPQAIDALVKDITKNGTRNQSGFALKTIGPRVIPNLLVALQNDRTWRETAEIVGVFKTACATRAPAWARIATDENRKTIERLAMLRAIWGCEYAAWVGGRVVVFNLQGILGIAPCA